MSHPATGFKYAALVTITLASMLGCPSPRAAPDRPGAPPAPEAAPPIVRSPGRWTLERDTGFTRYHIRNSATISLAGDTVVAPNSLSTVMVVSVTVGDAVDNLKLTGSIDSVVVQRGARISNSDSAPPLPIFLEGVLDRQGGVLELRNISLPTDSLCGTSLDPVVAMTRDLFVRLPSRLASGMTWQDTTRSTSCRGRIPVSTTTVASYTVLGEQFMEQHSLLAVSRNISLLLEGSGMQFGRAATVQGSGSGSGMLLIDPKNAALVESRTQSTITVTFEAGMLRQTFTQQGTQEIRQR